MVKEVAEAESLSATSVSPDPKAPIPKQIRYIIGNEGCERFSFYGMRNILTVFLVSSLLLYLPESERAHGAKDVFHTFVIGVYFFPLLGGWLADRFFGKYNTIFWLSLVYCAGQACLAMFVTNRTGFYIGLGLIALGSGGIKPCVAAFVGDQFDQTNKHRAKVVFEAFYWIINFGSFFASLLMPIFLRHLGPAVAFGVPGVLMFISTAILWAGRKQYVMIPPAPPDPHSFLRVSRDAIASGLRGQVLAAIAIASVIGSFALTPKFGFVIAACLALVGLIAFGGLGVWLQLDCVREQTSRGSYRRRAFGFACPCAVRVGDAILVVVRSESIDVGVAGKRDDEAELVSARADASTESCARYAPDSVQQPGALPRSQTFRLRANTITANDCWASSLPVSSWIVVGAMQLVLDHGDVFTITWQVLPYVLLTFGEVLVATTGLEFAYSQAPLSMKGAIMAFWNLSVTIGNLWVLVANASVQNSAVTKFIASTGFGVTAFQMFFFAVFAFAAALAFGLVARTYPFVDHYRRHEN